MKNLTLLKTIRVGTHSSLEEILRQKRHNGFLIDPAVVPALCTSRVSTDQRDIDLFCVPSHEITSERIPSVEKIYSDILSMGYMLCTAEMGLLAYPLGPSVHTPPQEDTYVAMEPLDGPTILRFSEQVPMSVDVKERAVFTELPVTFLDLTAYRPTWHGIGSWIFARQHE